MMQDLLTVLIEAIALGFVALMCVDFVVGLVRLATFPDRTFVREPHEQLFAQPVEPKCPPVEDHRLMEPDELVVVPNPKTNWSQVRHQLSMPN